MRPKVLFAAIGIAIAASAVFVWLFSDGSGLGGPPPPVIGASGVPPLVVPMAAPAARPAAMVPVARPVGGGAEAGLRPPNYIPSDIQLFEAHWQGMDARLLDSELRRKLKYPRGLLGILIDEVTLNAARAGFLAGDVIVQVVNRRVTTLEEFQQSSRAVRGLRQASITVLRKGDWKEDGRFAMRRITLALRGDPDLGFAQVEAAPMILPGDGRPHPYRGACTSCHTVGIGFELTPDPDLITLPPPPISHAIVVKEVSPHRNRGPCEACHVIRR